MSLPVLLDPGHGGTARSGKSTPDGVRFGDGRIEKQVNFDLARRVAQRLGGVPLTRAEHENRTLSGRVQAARDHRARAFVSLHTNDRVKDESAVWVHPHASPQSLRLANALRAALQPVYGDVQIARGELAVLSPPHHDRSTAACLVDLAFDGRADLDAIAAALARGVRSHLAGTGQASESTDFTDLPQAPEPAVPESFEELLHIVETGATVLDCAGILAELAPETLAAVVAAGELVGPVGWLADIVMVFVEIVNALDTGLRHDETMGWVYGITWAIDDEAAIRDHLPRTPRPTGVLYNPTGVGDPPEQRRERFDEGAQHGIDLIAGALTAEEKEVAARLTLALAIAVHQSGTVEGHKQFVTQLFRSAYKDGDRQHRETWSLDWPQMRVESIGS